MNKYYLVDAILMYNSYDYDMDATKVDMLYQGWPYAKINKKDIVTLLCTKTVGGFKEIKTGRFIPDTSLGKIHDNVRSLSLDISESQYRKSQTKGALLVTSSKSNYPLVRPVKNIEEVKEYMKKDVAEKLFGKLDELNERGIALYKYQKKKKRLSRKKALKSMLLSIRDNASNIIKKNQSEHKFNAEVKNEIKNSNNKRK